jgi:CheY-like chemotaxis protein
MAFPLTLKVLVADDDENDRFLVQHAFIRLGLSPPLALLRDGEQVIEYLLGQGDYSDRSTWPLPDLVLADHWMPRLSGIDVLNWIRSEPRFSNLAVLLVSGGLPPRQAAELAKLHAASCIKPNDFEELMAVLAQGFESALALAQSAEPGRTCRGKPLHHPETPW